MTMECKQIDDRLLDYMYEELEQADREAFEAHVGTCARCRAEVDGFGRVRRAMKELPMVEPPSAVSAKLIVAAARNVPKGKVIPLLRRVVHHPAYAMAAGFLVIAGVTGWQMLYRGKPAIAPPRLGSAESTLSPATPVAQAVAPEAAPDRPLPAGQPTEEKARPKEAPAEKPAIADPFKAGVLGRAGDGLPTGNTRSVAVPGMVDGKQARAGASLDDLLDQGRGPSPGKDKAAPVPADAVDAPAAKKTAWAAPPPAPTTVAAPSAIREHALAREQNQEMARSTLPAPPARPSAGNREEQAAERKRDESRSQAKAEAPAADEDRPQSPSPEPAQAAASGQTSQPPSRLEDLRNQAVRHAAVNNCREFEATVQQIRGLYPSYQASAQERLTEARCWARTGQTAKAERQLRDLLADAPGLRGEIEQELRQVAALNEANQGQNQLQNNLGQATEVDAERATQRRVATEAKAPAKPKAASAPAKASKANKAAAPAKSRVDSSY